jgi:hypothetical protein
VRFARACAVLVAGTDIRLGVMSDRGHRFWTVEVTRVLIGGLDGTGMSARRVAVVGTAAVVAVLAVILMVLRWDDADKVATVATALAAVAAVGVGIWATLPATSPGKRVRASRTGQATVGADGRANSGVSGPKSSLSGDIRADRTGDAEAPQGGEANTGIQLN